MAKNLSISESYKSEKLYKYQIFAKTPKNFGYFGICSEKKEGSFIFCNLQNNQISTTKSN